MELSDEVCLCFHVTKRKLENFARLERPRRASQMADCFGAGTGCGWCRPFLTRIFEAATGSAATDDEPTAADYAAARREYVAAGKGTPPPGASL